MNETYLFDTDISFGDFCQDEFKDDSPWTIVQINLMRCAVPV